MVKDGMPSRESARGNWIKKNERESYVFLKLFFSIIWPICLAVGLAALILYGSHYYTIGVVDRWLERRHSGNSE